MRKTLLLATLAIGGCDWFCFGQEVDPITLNDPPPYEITYRDMHATCLESLAEDGSCTITLTASEGFVNMALVRGEVSKQGVNPDDVSVTWDKVTLSFYDVELKDDATLIPVPDPQLLYWSYNVSVEGQQVLNGSGENTQSLLDAAQSISLSGPVVEKTLNAYETQGSISASGDVTMTMSRSVWEALPDNGRLVFRFTLTLDGLNGEKCVL